jgi:hypothetical protein
MACRAGEFLHGEMKLAKENNQIMRSNKFEGLLPQKEENKIINQCMK